MKKERSGKGGMGDDVIDEMRWNVMPRTRLMSVKSSPPSASSNTKSEREDAEATTSA